MLDKRWVILTQGLERIAREPGVKITKRLSNLYSFRLLPPEQLSSTKHLNTDLYENRGLVRALVCLHLKKCPVSVCFYSKRFSSSLIDVSCCNQSLVIDESSCNHEAYLRASVSKLRLINKRTRMIKIGIENLLGLVEQTEAIEIRFIKLATVQSCPQLVRNRYPTSSWIRNCIVCPSGGVIRSTQVVDRLCVSFNHVFFFLRHLHNLENDYVCIVITSLSTSLLNKLV